MGYNIQRIRLGKKEADSTFYNADVKRRKNAGDCGSPWHETKYCRV